MSNLIREFLLQHTPKPSESDVDELLAEVLTLTEGDPLKAARACLSARVQIEAQIKFASELLEQALKSRGLQIPLRHKNTVVDKAHARKRKSGKPRIGSRLPEGLTTKMVGKLAYWRKIRARMDGKIITNKETARAELLHLLRGLEPTEREIDDLAKRVSESEARQE